MNLTKKRFKKVMTILLIFLGIAIMLYPKVNESYTTYKQNKLMSLWEESLQSIESNVAEETPDIDTSLIDDISSSDYNNDYEELLIEKRALQKREYELKLLQEKERKKIEYIKKQREKYIKSHMEGVLKIPKISLSLPILKGTTKENLKFSVTSIDGTGKPWTNGNYGIAGHRSHSFGRNFNRLDELNPGDSIEVADIENKTYKYIVKQKLIVKAEDTWVLSNQENKKEITLVTCHPLYEKNPPTRLIIKGELQE